MRQLKTQSLSFKSVMLLVTMVALTGCLKTRSEIRGAVSGVDEKKQTATQQKAEQVVQLDEVSTEVRELNGRIEVLENELRMRKQSQQEQGQSDANSINAVNDKLRLYEQALVKLESVVLEQRAQIEGLKKGGGQSSSKAKGKTAKAPKAAGNYTSAQKDFANKNWKQAIFNYQKYRDLNPKGKRYAEATYKMGVSFQELGMKNEAKTFFEELLQKYPKGSFSKKARYRLKGLK